MSIKHDHTLNPVTALEFYSTSTGIQLILAGEGSYLKAFESKTSKLLCECKIFEGQAIHGIAVRQIDSHEEDDLQVVIWGGASLVSLRKKDILQILSQDTKDVSTIVNTVSDWILDVAICPFIGDNFIIVTAHNTVLRAKAKKNSQEVHLEELHSPSRSILYSAHIVWESKDTVLVAAGTVFGEIIVWQCFPFTDSLSMESRVLHTFTGHEGSIFGVNISIPVFDEDGNATRLLASCSDDRTIRIWNLVLDEKISGQKLLELPHARETGFGNSSEQDDPSKTSSQCLAMAMGHASRIWQVRFLVRNSSITVLSFGEDATTQHWALKHSGYNSISSEDSHNDVSISPKLFHVDTFAFNSGKHVWSTAIHQINDSATIVATGGADGKISLCEILIDTLDAITSSKSEQLEKFRPDDMDRKTSTLPPIQSNPWELEDVLNTLHTNSNPPTTNTEPPLMEPPQGENPNSKSADAKPAKKQKPRKVLKDVFNRYAFISENHVLLTTTFGRVLLCEIGEPMKWKEIEMPESCRQDLKSYSIIKGVSEIGLAFLAGVNGKIFMYRSGSGIVEVGKVEGKVADMFVSTYNTEQRSVELLVITLGGKLATLFFISRPDPPLDEVLKEVEYHLPGNLVVTSAGQCRSLLVLGFRNGSLAIYDHSKRDQPIGTWVPDQTCSGDAITSIISLSGLTGSDSTYFLTTGRDGSYSIFSTAIIRNEGRIISAIICAVHHGSPPFGPMIEAAWFDGSDLILYGFKSKNFVVWNETKQYEIASVECGGAHRSYAYSPLAGSNGAGYFIYTKVSKLFLHSQHQPSHQIIKPGGHGREIKACAVSPDNGLIATGAEDTAIRIWQYQDGGSVLDNRFECLAVVQKHTTGIQHLQWHGSKYLFSSGGYEEFFIWAVDSIPGIGMGIVCEATCPDQTGDRDLRIMSFDVSELDHSADESRLLLSLAFSDSTIRTYTYSKAEKFKLVATGRYTSSCLMQLRHVQIREDVLYLLTAATDGNLTVWKTAIRKSSSAEKQVITPSQTLEMVSNHRLHQSSIKSLDFTITKDRKVVVATGGDDNALGVTVYQSEKMESKPKSIIVRSAHAAAVTGLCFLLWKTDEQRIVTSSNDQRVKEWSLRLSPGGGSEVKLEKTGDVFTSVADVGDVAAVGSSGKRDGSKKVLVVGNGMEVYHVSRDADPKSDAV